MRYCFLTLFLLMSHGSLAQSSAGDAYYEQGKNFLERKQTDKSLKAFDRARTEYLREKNWERYFVATQTLSMYYQDTGKGQESEKLLTEAVAAVPVNFPGGMIIQAKLHDNLGYTYLNVMGDPGKAIEAYSTSIRWYEQSGKAASAELAFERTNRATAYYAEGSFEEAAGDFVKAISLYESDPSVEKGTLASTYFSSGSCFLALLRNEEAKVYFEKALSIVPADDQEMTADIHNNLSMAQEGMANYRDALDHVQKAKVIYGQLFGRDPDHYGQACINSGKVYSTMGDYLAALQQYQEVLDIYGKTPPENIQDLMSLMVSVGSASNQLGMRDQAKVVYEETLKLIQSQPGDNSLLLADVYAKMAAVAFDDGEYDRSLEFNFKALDIVQSQNLKDPVMLALINNNVGQAYDMLMELTLALQYKNQALEIFRKLHGENHPDVALAISNIGLTYEMFEDYDKALEFLYRALDMRIKMLGPSHKEVGTTYLNIGVMQLKKGDTDKAIAHLEKAVAVYEPFSKFDFKATAFNTLGFAWFLKRDFSKSGLYFQKAISANVMNVDDQPSDAIPQNPEYLDYNELITSYVGKADVFRMKGDLASLTLGLKHLDAADRILKKTSTLMNNPKDRLKLAQLNFFLTESGMQLVDKLMKVSPDDKYLAKAFYFSERNKANELYGDIRASRTATLVRIPAGLLTRQREIAGMIQSTEQQLASAYASRDQALIMKFKSQLFNWSAENESIEQDMAKASPAYASVTGLQSLPGWTEVKAALGPGTALVSYTITDSARYVLIGTSDRLVLRSIAGGRDLEKMVRGFRNQIRFHEPLMTSGKSLADVVWKPVEDVLDQMGSIGNIIIIPDGPLSLLPFEALQSNGKYLLERYNLRYNISSALMLQPARGEVPKKPSLIALAPVFADEETNFVNKSCERFAGAALKTDAATRSFSVDGSYITPLPATEVEVQEIYKVLSATDPFSKYFLKKEANEELIKKGELARYDYIHFATHGLVNTQYPELSGLLLAQNKQSKEDGILYTGEIFGLDLKAQLVTLSACETALGKRVEGEGVRGLTSAFLLAGARTVVVSLWKVADESTAKLMISFYNQLLAGKDKSSSLREAKLSLLQDSKYAHPFYWAPFVQIGAN